MEIGGVPERVLVLGDDMRVFLGVVRSLGRAGKEVHAAPIKPDSPALKSRYVSRVHLLPRYADDPRAWLTALLGILHSQSIALVVPCSDNAILPLDAHRGELAAFRLAIPPAEAMGPLFDKERTRRLAADLGIPVAQGARLGPNDGADYLAGRFGLPLVIKPQSSYAMDRLETWGKVHICDTASELREVLSTIGDRSRQLVEGYFEGVGVGVSVLAENGEILQAFQHRRLRQGRGGSSSYRISEPVDPSLLGACEKICRATKLTGVCMFEFRYNRADRSWILLETNARFWGSSPLPISLGVDFPRFLYDLLVHGVRHPPAAYRAGIRSRNFVLDGYNLLGTAKGLRRKDIGAWAADLGDFLAQPLRWMSGGERSDQFVRDDPLPGLWELAMIGKSAGANLARRGAARKPPRSDAAAVLTSAGPERQAG